MKQLVEKQKELHYTKALQKDNMERSTTPFHFEVLAQLANIPTWITLYELLRLSKTTKDRLRDFYSSDSYCARRGRRQTLSSYVKAILMHYIHT